MLPLDVMINGRGRKQMLALGLKSLKSNCEVTVDVANVPWVSGQSGVQCKLSPTLSHKIPWVPWINREITVSLLKLCKLYRYIFLNTKTTSSVHLVTYMHVFRLTILYCITN